MKPVTLTVVKQGNDIFFDVIETLCAADLLDMLEIPERENLEFEIVIVVKRPKPKVVIDIFNDPDDAKFQYYKELDTLYKQGEIIFKEKTTRNNTPSISIKCSRYELITDIASLNRYFKQKGKDVKDEAIDTTADSRIQ